MSLKAIKTKPNGRPKAAKADLRSCRVTVLFTEAEKGHIEVVRKDEKLVDLIRRSVLKSTKFVKVA